tara:strand:+ start:410 stop:610 length:201 start_codon:yes stop_codon:yes gene_type:complete
MNMELNIEMDNAAFDERVAPETERIFAAIIQSIKSGNMHGTERDINGNTVCAWIIRGHQDRYSEEE